MKIDLRNRNREPLYTVKLDPKDPPSVVRDPKGQGPEVFLEWDQSIDDQGTLRRCPCCGCRDLFVRKDFAQVTALALVVLAAIFSLGLYGLVGSRFLLPAGVLLGIVIVIDVLIYLYSPRCVVCYQCHSEFRDMPIGVHLHAWEPTTGERYRNVPAQRSSRP